MFDTHAIGVMLPNNGFPLTSSFRREPSLLIGCFTASILIYKVAGANARSVSAGVSVKGFRIRDLRNGPIFVGFVQVGKIVTR